MAQDGNIRQWLLPGDASHYGSHHSDRVRSSHDVRRDGSCTPGGTTLSRQESATDLSPVTLSWEKIRVFVNSEHMDAEQGTSAAGSKQIIKDVSGVVQPGALLAILGARMVSQHIGKPFALHHVRRPFTRGGAGKSTLMNVLTNRNLKGYQIMGDVKVNGRVVGNDIRNISAYVQQDDLFFGTLTVRETLIFRAMLQMDKTMSKTARMERVEEVIVEMGLSNCADTQVGIPGAKKGISGGESKRLSFACEMLTSPPLMFCDEPTSGLDTFMAQNIVSVLQAMAQKKRTILCTIHQPSSEIFAMFDQVLLLAEGRVAFMGSSANALEFFSSLNYTCPTNFNPADFYILTLAIVPNEEEECRAKVHAICDAFVDSQDSKEIQRQIDEISFNDREAASLMKEASSSESRYRAAGWCQQFRTVLGRSWISHSRDVALLRFRVMQTLVMTLFVGLIFLRLDYNQKGVMNINGAIIMILIMTTIPNILCYINTFPQEVSIFLREYGSGLYRTDVYFIAKNMAELPSCITMPAVSMSIAYWMIGLREEWQAFLIATAVIVLLANTCNSVGLLVSTLCPNVNIALPTTSVILLSTFVFGGFFLNADTFPVYFEWLSYVSWFKYSNEYLAVNQWHNYGNITCENSSGRTPIPCQFRNGDDVLQYLSFSADNNWLNVGAMFALLCGFRIMAFICLLVRARSANT